jgi:hypothetical protein
MSSTRGIQVAKAAQDEVRAFLEKKFGADIFLEPPLKQNDVVYADLRQLHSSGVPFAQGPLRIVELDTKRARLEGRLKGKLFWLPTSVLRRKPFSA